MLLAWRLVVFIVWNVFTMRSARSLTRHVNLRKNMKKNSCRSGARCKVHYSLYRCLSYSIVSVSPCQSNVTKLNNKWICKLWSQLSWENQIEVVLYEVVPCRKKDPKLEPILGQSEIRNTPILQKWYPLVVPRLSQLSPPLANIGNGQSPI